MIVKHFKHIYHILTLMLHIFVEKVHQIPIRDNSIFNQYYMRNKYLKYLEVVGNR